MVFRNGTVHDLPPHHPPLGILLYATDDDHGPVQSTVQLAPGDRILLASDGLSEAFDERDEQFGSARIVELCRRSEQTATPELVIERLRRALDEHCGGQNKLDDVTILCIDQV